MEKLIKHGLALQLYINTLNIIHYMHDKYTYENYNVSIGCRAACGIAGLSVVADSLSAIKYSR